MLYVGKAKSLRKRMRQYASGQDEREKIPLMMEQVDELRLRRDQQRGRVAHPREEPHQAVPAAATTSTTATTRATRSSRSRSATRSRRSSTRARSTSRARATSARTPTRGPRARPSTSCAASYPICRATCVEWKRVTAQGGAPAGRPCFDYHVGWARARASARSRARSTPRTSRASRGSSRASTTTSRASSSARCARPRPTSTSRRAARYRNRLEAVARDPRAPEGRQRAAARLGRHRLLPRGDHRRRARLRRARGSRARRQRVRARQGPRRRRCPSSSRASCCATTPTAPTIPREIVAARAARGRRGRRGVARRRCAAREVRARGARSAARSATCSTSPSDNARHTLMRFKVRTRYDEERLNTALLQLESALALPAPPLRIECYDISTLHGTHSVGSMVVFTQRPCRLEELPPLPGAARHAARRTTSR